MMKKREISNCKQNISAAAYSQQGDHEKAVNDAKKAVEVDPKYSKAYSRMG